MSYSRIILRKMIKASKTKSFVPIVFSDPRKFLNTSISKKELGT